MKKKLQLGLIGDNIQRSKSPLFHYLAGQQNGIEVDYVRLIPKDLQKNFDDVFSSCLDGSFTGINITYPYKEQILNRVSPSSDAIAALGAVNTVLFTADGPVGYNTDYSGFIKTYQSARSELELGTVCLMGAGGVGKAIAFGLSELGAVEIRLFDIEKNRAEALARQIEDTGTHSRIRVCDDLEKATMQADGFVNCTPVGMAGNSGTPLPAAHLDNAKWVFDAVYTPVETQFLKEAARKSAQIISGYELFFFQAVDAWKLFSGLPLDEAAMRISLLSKENLQ